MKPIGIAFLGCMSAIWAQPLSYTLVEAEGTKPSARFDGTIAYDPAGRRVILFGGSGNGELNDLWSYSLAQRRWEELRPEGDKPPARLGHTLVLDSRRQRLVLFGGQASGFFNDTWAYDLAQNRWSRIAADGAAPSRRYGHSAILDAERDRMIVSHGFTNSGRFDDTWALDLATGTWRDISPSSGRPLRRCLHHAVYDAAGGQMLLYGGCASGFGPCPLGDLWSFDLASHRWTEITGSAKPPAREHYGLSYDNVRNRMIVFGGTGAGLLGDTWEFDPRSRSWREAEIMGPAPSARSRHHGVFAEGRGVTFFFGGTTASSLSNDLWMLGPAFAAPPRPELSRTGVVNASSGSADGAVAPGELIALHGSGLGPIEGVALGLDPLTGTLPVSGPGVSVSINGIPAPLMFVSANQINAQVPYEIEGSAEAVIRATVNGAVSDAVTVRIEGAKPGLFNQAFRPDGSTVNAENPALRGEVIVLLATGQGVTVPPSRTGAIPDDGVNAVPAAPVTLTVGGSQTELLYRGQAPGMVGVLQLNARVPEDLEPGAETPIALRVGSADARSITIPVR